MSKTTFVTLAAARKRLAQAYAKIDEAVSIRHPGSLGGKVHQLEGGIKTSKQRAVRTARALVEMMVAHELTRVERLVIEGDHMEDPGYSVVYLRDTEVLLIQHSSCDRVGLGLWRQEDLDRFLKARKEAQQ